MDNSGSSRGKRVPNVRITVGNRPASPDHPMVDFMPSDCANKAERDFAFLCRTLDLMAAHSELDHERRCWALHMMQGPSEAVH